jgi:hypothetical protein
VRLFYPMQTFYNSRNKRVMLLRVLVSHWTQNGRLMNDGDLYLAASAPCYHIARRSE